MSRAVRVRGQAQKDFLKVFNELCYTRSAWQVWADLMSMMACSICNAVDRREDGFNRREREYKQCVERLGGLEKPTQLFVSIVNALEEDPDQDFLGEMYMQLELGNHWKGQFFTPYTVCRAMAEITIGNVNEHIENHGYISICDPACGAGATLIAAVNSIRRQNINFHDYALFVGQDIDRVVGQMCYIQLSLLGCPGYIVIGNSLSNPIVGKPLMPNEQEGQEFWYTPFFFSQTWVLRRQFSMMDSILFSTTIADIDKHNDTADLSPTYDINLDLKESDNGQLQFNF